MSPPRSQVSLGRGREVTLRSLSFLVHRAKLGYGSDASFGLMLWLRGALRPGAAHVYRTSSDQNSITLGSTLQDEIHHMVIFGFVLCLQPLGEVNQMNLDLIDDGVLFEDSLRHLIRHRR